MMTTGVTLSDDVIKVSPFTHTFIKLSVEDKHRDSQRLAKLGVKMTTKPTDCTHLVAKGIVRTEKFLCAMSVSPFVLTEEWANASAKSGKLQGARKFQLHFRQVAYPFAIAEEDYLLSDFSAEKKWQFKFADSVERSKGPDGGTNLFKQLTFYVTPKVPIDIKLLKNVISVSGGQVNLPISFVAFPES